MVREAVTRSSIEYKDISERYILEEEDYKDCFQRQYFHIYTTRLEQLKPRVLAAAEHEIGKGKFKYQLLEAAHKEEEIFVIGIIEKRISQRPSILKEIADDEHILPDAEEETDSNELLNLVSSEDFLELEDEKQIVKIEGGLGMDDVATGCVVGLLGYQVKSNVFHVSRVIYPCFPRPQSPLSSLDSSPIIAFVSGLDIAGDRTDDAMCTDFLLMSKWLCGEMSLSEEDENLAARVTRLVIGGESVTSKMADGLNSTIHYLTLRRQDHNPSVEALQTFDKLVCNLVGKIRVDVMPGIGDPAIQLFPQQPVHKIALPHAGFAGKALHLTTNPYNFTLRDRELLVTSGQNASDIRRLSGVKSGCDILSLFLKWNLLAPTFPDTVDGFPFVDRDPALMGSIPHIFVATNQPSAEHRMWKSKTSDESCLLLSVPRFSKTRMLTLVDVNTREVTYKVFGTP